MKWRTASCSRLVGILAVAILPYIHIGIFHLKIWVPDKQPVDRNQCGCPCWDTVFKGTYEGHEHIRYKHIYFNATVQTYIVWILTVCIIVAAYEAFKYIWTTFRAKELRMTMAFLFLLDIYPNYYSWWNYFNYLNDDFYDQFFHQLFFTITELISTCIIINLCSEKNHMDKWKVMVIVCISSVHLLIGGVDQFFVQLFLGEGQIFQKMRNIGFVVPDFCHILLPILEYWRSYRKDLSNINQHRPLLSKVDIMYGTGAICGGFFIGKLILT